MPLSTFRASRACRAFRDKRVRRAIRRARHVSTRLFTTVLYAKIIGLGET